MSRTLRIPRLGVGGRRTDSPSWALGLDELGDGSWDGVVQEGDLRRRRGTKVVSTVAGAEQYAAVYRASFQTARRTATYTVRTRFNGFNAAIIDSGVPLTWPGELPATTPVRLPRAMYQDRMLFCAQDGVNWMMMASGADPAVTPASVGAISSAVGSATLTAATSITTTRGSWAGVLHENTALTIVCPSLFVRVLETTPTTMTVEHLKASAVIASVASLVSHIAPPYPAVAIYDAGVASTAGGGATGVGTKWLSLPGVAASQSFGFLTTASPPFRHYSATPSVGFGGDTVIDGAMATASNLNYALTSRCPFKDVCVHDETLYGVGVAAYPSRVYVAPAGWDPSLPPGATLPVDFATEFTSSSTADFLLDTIDVPDPFDSDPIVAILATDGPRLVLKKKSVYGLYGSPPLLDPKLLHSGDGCIDIQSSISVESGAFWAGWDGVYRWRGGRVEDLTAGWMRTEWRALTNAGIDFVACGVDGRYLVVSVKTADAAQQKRTYLYDLELARWLPEITNIHPRHIFNANIAGELQQLLCVDDAYPGKVLNLRSALDGSGPARDEVGTGPNFRVVTGDNLIGAGGTEQESRVLEVDVHANVSDPGGTTTLTVQATHGGALRGDGAGLYGAVTYGGGTYYGPDGGKALGTITGDTDMDTDRHPFAVNRMGRRMGLVIEETTTSSTVQEVALGELVVQMRDARKGT